MSVPHPIPCIHCGMNFMQSFPKSERLCNSCLLKEQKKNPKEKSKDIIQVLVKFDPEIYRLIEEYCIKNSMDISDYILSLYNEEVKKSENEILNSQENVSKKQIKTKKTIE